MSNNAELRFPLRADLQDWIVLLKSFGSIQCEICLDDGFDFKFPVYFHEFSIWDAQVLRHAISTKFQALANSQKIDSTGGSVVLSIASKAA